MKKFFCIYFLLIPLLTQSQHNIPEHDLKALHFGFTLGLNTMDFKVKHAGAGLENNFFAEVSSLTPGFNINVVSNFRLSDYFAIRILPGVAFGQRRIDYYSIAGEPGLPGSINWNEQSVVRESYQDLESSYLELPFVLKYKSVRLDNYKPYLIGGINLRYDLAKNFSEDDEIYLGLKPFNIYLETGFGIDFYLPYFKFSTEIKFARGFLNMLESRYAGLPFDNKTRYENAIESIRSNLLIFSFHFE
jgi:hypothetical protein